MGTYYAAVNDYSTPNSVGFANTWGVIAFDSRKARDAFVANSPNLATRAITKKEVTRYASNWDNNRNEMSKPKPFSGQYWGIVDEHPEWTAAGRPDGYIGVVQVCDDYGYGPSVAARVYR